MVSEIVALVCERCYCDMRLGAQQYSSTSTTSRNGKTWRGRKYLYDLEEVNWLARPTFRFAANRHIYAYQFFSFYRWIYKGMSGIQSVMMENKSKLD